MTDKELRTGAEDQLKKTTLGWNKVKTYSPEKLRATYWGRGLDLLSQISVANATTRNAAVGYLKKTTSGYKPTAKNWKLAFAELAKIVDATAWTKIADEHQQFTLTTAAEVRYGTGTAWNTKVLAAGTYFCDNARFGDPLPGASKQCEKRSGVPQPPDLARYPATSLYPAEVMP